MRKGLSLFLVLLLVFCSGCSLLPEKKEVAEQAEDRLPEPPPVQQPNLRETMLYLPNETHQFLLPLRVYIPWEEGIAKATLTYCTAGNLLPEVAALGVAPLLPAGTAITGLSVREGLARVDFSEEFLDYLPEQEEQIINGLTYTLTEFSTIDAVEILCAGQQLQTLAATAPTPPLSREFVLNLEAPVAADDSASMQRITLYFLHEVGSRIFYVPVTRLVAETAELLPTIAKELLLGPKPGTSLLTAVPSGLTLKEITTEGSKVVLHLSGELSADGGQLAADLLRQQLALTFTEIHGITEVAVLCNDKPPELDSGVDFPASFGRPKQWNLVQ
ncbi:MAG TPA: GerMN domain-containing protein [Oscillospiraceae bacterium]|nr:GerMN domain-containing protein [Oscillospiraceae bacterium]